MELRQLRYFIAVAEEQNFGAAAKRLNVTQPPVTRQVHALEQELGVKLFSRTARGSQLTEAGQLLLHEAREIVERTNRARERTRAADAGELGSLNVGFFGSPIYGVIPTLLRGFSAQVPEVRIALTRMTKSRQIEALRAGTIDIGFSRYFVPTSDVVVETVAEERLCVALPIGNPLAECSSLSLRDLKKYPLIVFPNASRPSFADQVIGILAESGIRANVRAEAEDAVSALVLVSIGLGVCLAPESTRAIRIPGVVFAALSDPDVKTATHCVYRKSSTSPILHRFLSVIRKIR